MKIDAGKMGMAADAASAMLKALANRHRLLLLCQLVSGERSVGELADAVGLRDSTVSQHLALLRKDGLVATRRQGQTIWYRIASTPAAGVLEALYRVYCEPQAPCAPAPGISRLAPGAKTTKAAKTKTIARRKTAARI